jgi:LPS O-antigen subunit length determinant protein (WzzB/FepE family)
MTAETNNNQPPTQESEVDFINLAKTFWDGRIVIGKLILVSMIIGFFVAILTPNEFTASSTMVPQISDPKSKLAGLSGLAAMAGLNINTSASYDLSPRTYSSIISSTPFQLELMQTKLNFEKLDSQITLFDYYTKIKTGNPLIKYTLQLPSTILRKIKGKTKSKFTSQNVNPLFVLTDNQIGVQKIIGNQVRIMVNDLDGYVSFNCSLPEAYAAAQLVQNAQTLLQQYITEFKIEKAKNELDFVEQRYAEAKKNYQNAQHLLALFRDSHMNASTSVAKSEEERLTNEYTIVTGVYTELAKLLEQAKIHVKEETPVFTIIKPVSVPTEKSSPNRPLILVISAIVGLCIGTAIVLGKVLLIQIQEKWRNSNHLLNNL